MNKVIRKTNKHASVTHIAEFRPRTDQLTDQCKEEQLQNVKHHPKY